MESLAEVVAMLWECGALRLTGKSGDPTAGDDNGELRDPAAAVNGPALLPTDGKVGAEIQPGVGIDVTGGGGSARLSRRYCRSVT